MSVAIFAPPPDWPSKVTQAGSPPKAAMLSRTQRSASTRSSMPAFPESGKTGQIEIAEEIQPVIDA